MRAVPSDPPRRTARSFAALEVRGGPLPRLDQSVLDSCRVPLDAELEVLTVLLSSPDRVPDNGVIGGLEVREGVLRASVELGRARWRERR